MLLRIFTENTEIIFDAFGSITMIKLFSTVTTSSFLAVGFVIPVAAQVIPDGTTSTTVDVDGTINNGDRAGGNLFHSFTEFSVPTSGQAFFNNSVDIVNIFSRVTGGNLSNIDGILGANGTANLFLINPAGIIFGENASLSIGGSFYGTSADRIVFPEGEFSATDLANPPLITINAPLGLGIRDNPGDITANGVGLFVNESETISLIGGNVNIQNGGIVFAPGGRVELGGLTEVGTVSFNENGSLTFPGNIVRGDVSVTEGSLIAVSSGDGGSISINASNLEISSGSNFFAGIFIDSGSTDVQAGDVIINLTEDLVIDGIGSENITTITNTNLATGNAGNIEINARNVTFSNGGNITSNNNGQGNIGDIIINATGNISLDGTQNSLTSGIANFVLEEATGDVGKIEITAQNLSITNGANIQSLVDGNANAGDISINVADTIIVDGFSIVDNSGDNSVLPSVISSGITNNGNGDSGNININTQNLFLSRNGSVSGSIIGIGNSGDININADIITIGEQGNTAISPSSIRSDVLGNPTLDANAGNITINTRSLSISDGSRVSADVTGLGNGGNITINATESISVEGIERINNVEIISEISSDILDGSFGNAGDLMINTSNLSVSNGAEISSDISGTGNSGNIEINTTDLSLTDIGLISARILIGGQGEAGSLNINATGSIEILGLSGINANLSEDAIGIGGDLFLQAENLTLSGGSQISASTSGAGNAGSVTISVNETIELIGQSELGRSGLFANATISNGNGGDLNVFTDSLILRDGATVQASNFQSLGLSQPGSGNSGDIIINAETIVAFPNKNNDIVANALQGNGGNINITADAILGIVERPQNPNTNDIDASSQATGLDGTVNIFTPDINSLQSVDRLRVNTVSANVIGTDACSTAGGESNFIIKGKGGVTPKPTAPFPADVLIIDGQVIALEKNPNYIPENIKPIPTDNGDLYPARGIVKTADGKIILTAYPNPNTTTRNLEKSLGCS
ncbi:MAG: S-layer family protein [Cyanobacteria bacterium P01_F01_bin.143]